MKLNYLTPFTTKHTYVSVFLVNYERIRPVAKKQREDSRQFSVKFPTHLVDEIDTICTANYISRSAWLIKAARELLEKERKSNAEELLQKLGKQEND